MSKSRKKKKDYKEKEERQGRKLAADLFARLMLTENECIIVLYNWTSILH